VDDLKPVLPAHVISLIYSRRALAHRLKVEASYFLLTKIQKEEAEDVQKSDSLLLPPDIPYHE